MTERQIVLVAALVSPIVEDEPALGGAQSFVVTLAHGLVQRGHHVTLLAASGSQISGVAVPDLGIDAALLAPATFVSGDAAAVAPGRSDLREQAEAFGRVRAWIDQHSQEIDAVHAHAYDRPAFEALAGLPVPVLHTLHLPPLDPDVVSAARAATDATLVAVSEVSAQAWRAAGVPIGAVVSNGVDPDAIRFEPCPGTYLLYAGRISPDKGPDHALAAALAYDRPLLLVGGLYDREFYAREIEPRVEVRLDWQPGDDLGSGATFIGPRPRAELFELMAGAAGLLMPTRLDESFGLVAAEAMAAGCPVVAYARGGLTSVVANGRGGWLVPPDDLAALTAAVGRLGEIDRAACRAWVVERFALARMLDGYERLYEQAGASGQP